MKTLKRLCTLGVVGGVLLGFAATGIANADEPVEPETTAVVEEAVPVEEVPVPETTPVEETPEVLPEEEVPAPVAKKTVTPPAFEAYEVCATWETASIDRVWPQTNLSKECGYVPAQRCEAYQVQFDKYWIRDEQDKAYFASLTGLNSHLDDQSLEPHGYVVYKIPAKDCTPPKPDNLVTYTEWETGKYVCDDTTVQITREVTSTEYVLVEGEWVAEGESETTTQTETRDLTAEEISALECPVVVPPVVTPPTEKPATVVKTTTPPETGETLANTGLDNASSIGFGILGVILLAAGATIVVTRRIMANN